MAVVVNILSRASAFRHDWPASCLGDGSGSAPPPLPFEDIGHQVPDTSQWLPGTYSPASNFEWTLFQCHEQSGPQQEYCKSVTPSPSLYFFYLMDLATSRTPSAIRYIVLTACKTVGLRLKVALASIVKRWTSGYLGYTLLWPLKTMMVIHSLGIDHITKSPWRCTITALE
jgi:hypothetical protein